MIPLPPGWTERTEWDSQAADSAGRLALCQRADRTITYYPRWWLALAWPLVRPQGGVPPERRLGPPEVDVQVVALAAEPDPGSGHQVGEVLTPDDRHVGLAARKPASGHPDH